MSKSKKLNLGSGSVIMEIRPLSNELSEDVMKYIECQKWANDMFKASASELLRIPKEYFGK